MKMNNGTMGDLKKTTLRVGSHEVSIVVGEEVIKASVKEVHANGIAQ